MNRQAWRFRDRVENGSLYALAGHPIDVVCPRCTAHGFVIADPGDDASPFTGMRRLVCRGCGHAETWVSRGNGTSWGTTVDPYFKRPLWLTATVRGRRLWAYNREHLELLDRIAGAGLRERGPVNSCSMSMFEKLPAWIKSARHREDVLGAIQRLRTRLDDPGEVVVPARPSRRSVRRRHTDTDELERSAGPRLVVLAAAPTDHRDR